MPALFICFNLLFPPRNSHSRTQMHNHKTRHTHICTEEGEGERAGAREEREQRVHNVYKRRQLRISIVNAHWKRSQKSPDPGPKRQNSMTGGSQSTRARSLLTIIALALQCGGSSLQF